LLSSIGLAFFVHLFFALSVFGLDIVSRSDEYRADAFALADALIPINDLAEALVTLEHHITEQNNTAVGLSSRMKKALIAVVGKTHPSIEQRIRRLRIVYGDKLFLRFHLEEFLEHIRY
jgi:Zn-dependent protease with chaperone function